MNSDDVQFGWHQLGVRRSFAGWSPDEWHVNLQGAVEREWTPPTWGELVKLTA